jgi:hypothetical protein
MTAAGFKRLWSMPRRALRGGTFAEFSARGRYLVEQSRARYHRRPDAYAPGTEPHFTGELGHVESFRFITSPPTPAALMASYQSAVRTGTGAVILGIDPAGQDWTTIVSWPDLVPVELPRPALTLLDLQRITKAELKRGRRADKLRQLAKAGAIGTLSTY